MAEQEARRSGISPRGEGYARWYGQVVRAAGVAHESGVRGCAVLEPWGQALWENVQRELDARLKATGHRNVYLPLLIPRSVLARERSPGEGLAGACAVVTHHGLARGVGGHLIPDPAARLADPLVVRPTSETLAAAVFARWVRSYRDLPVLVNQWANVVRWERRTHLLLRSVELLWQEGHTAHETEAEAREEARRMLDLYAAFAEDVLALPVLRGRKSHRERFPGAVETYAIEALMADGRALQAGTSHFLGQGFSQASTIAFQARDGTRQIAWTTSWGVSTRLLGAVILAHGDDDGLRLPPQLAPTQVVILPILRGDDAGDRVFAHAGALAAEIAALRFGERPIAVEIDRRGARDPGRIWPWVRRGVPVRIEVGAREVLADSASLSRRDRSPRDRVPLSRGELMASLPRILDEIQRDLHARALAFREDHTRVLDDRAELDAFFAKPSPGGLALSPWCGRAACEDALHRALAVTIRCAPVGAQPGARWAGREGEPGRCIACGAPSAGRVILARAH